jgi:protein ImuA
MRGSANSGWPLGTCIEVLTDASGMGAMGLFLPAMEIPEPAAALAGLHRSALHALCPAARRARYRYAQVLLVHPRDREEQLWSTEQALRSGTCSAVFSWLGGRVPLRGAASPAAGGGAGQYAGGAVPTPEAAHQHAPASLRLQMEAYREVQILKQRSGLQDINVYLPPEDDVPHQPQLWELPADADGATRSLRRSIDYRETRSMEPFPSPLRRYCQRHRQRRPRVACEPKTYREIVSAPPAEFGGPGDKWSPESLLIAAVADCFVLSFRAIARASKLEWSRSALRRLRHPGPGGARHALYRDQRQGDAGVACRGGCVRPRQPIVEKAEKLLHKAEASCLITNSLIADSSLSTEISVAD